MVLLVYSYKRGVDQHLGTGWFERGHGLEWDYLIGLIYQVWSWTSSVYITKLEWDYPVCVAFYFYNEGMVGRVGRGGGSTGAHSIVA